MKIPDASQERSSQIASLKGRLSDVTPTLKTLQGGGRLQDFESEQDSSYIN